MEYINFSKGLKVRSTPEGLELDSDKQLSKEEVADQLIELSTLRCMDDKCTGEHCQPCQIREQAKGLIKRELLRE